MYLSMQKPGKTGQDGQKPTGAAAWPGMPALSNLKTNAANGNGYHANGKTSLEASGRDTDRILSGLTSSQPTTPMSLGKPSHPHKQNTNKNLLCPLLK